MLAWRHEAERLDGEPAPRFASETLFEIRLEPEGERHGGSGCIPARSPPGGSVGLVIRALESAKWPRTWSAHVERLAAAG